MILETFHTYLEPSAPPLIHSTNNSTVLHLYAHLGHLKRQQMREIHLLLSLKNTRSISTKAYTDAEMHAHEGALYIAAVAMP